MSRPTTPKPTRRAVLAGMSGAAALTAIFPLPGCSSQNSPSGTESVPLPERLTNRQEVVIAMDPSTVKAPFDPIKGFGESGVLLFNSPLLTADEKNQIVNDVATGYETSPDGLVWTFKIRTDIKFTDGTALTAEDVAFTYNQAKEAAKVILPGFDTAVATGTDTVELRLTAPSSTLLYTAATLGIVPKSTYSDGFGDNPVGSGPWKFGHYTQGQQLILERNDNYHGTKAKFAKATLLLMESDAALAAAQSGQVDLACVYPALSSQQIPGFSLTSLPTFDPRVISLPCVAPGAYEVEGQSVGNAVTSDPVIRKAMATALNREQIVKDCLLGYGEVAFDIFDAFPWGIKQETASLKDGDVAGADAMLDQAGWTKGEGGIREKNGTKATFTLMYPPNDSGRQAIAEAFKAQMTQIGIDVELHGTDFTSMQDRNRKDAVVLGGGRLNPYHEYNMLSGTLARKKGWSNIACYSNEQVQANLDAALAATDQESANKFWHAALWDGTNGGSVLGDNPYLVVGYIHHNYFVRNGLDIGTQRVHPHDHFLQVINNLNTWDVKAS